jgi:LysR family hydrogen peroxide-inducible transcriptional activator
MNLRTLGYLVALAEHLHFSKAAEACFVSQPTLSMQIKKLEDELGVLLLERTNKSVLLTETGLAVAARAKMIRQQIAEIHDIAKLAQDPYGGELKLGIIPTVAPYLLPQIMPALLNTFPNLKLYLVEEQTAVLVEQIREGNLDAAILALPIEVAGLEMNSLFAEEFQLALPKSHSLAKRKAIKQTDLKNKTLLLLDEGHCLRDQALAICQLSHAKESKSFQATSLETLRQLVASGMGMTLMPKLACFPNRAISYVAFSHPKPIRTIGLLHRTSTTKKVLLGKIIKVIRDSILQQKLGAGA